jgi:hypothetical protein
MVDRQDRCDLTLLAKKDVIREPLYRRDPSFLRARSKPAWHQRDCVNRLANATAEGITQAERLRIIPSGRGVNVSLRK